jgi:hypothetical protein
MEYKRKRIPSDYFISPECFVTSMDELYDFAKDTVSPLSKDSIKYGMQYLPDTAKPKGVSSSPVVNCSFN